MILPMRAHSVCIQDETSAFQYATLAMVRAIVLCRCLRRPTIISRSSCIQINLKPIYSYASYKRKCIRTTNRTMCAPKSTILINNL